MIRQYVGTRTDAGLVVSVVLEDGSVHQLGSSSTLFEWGHASGMRPAQLALSICLDALDDLARARSVFQAFKFLVVAKLDREKWSLTKPEVLERVHEIELAVKEREIRSADARPF